MAWFLHDNGLRHERVQGFFPWKKSVFQNTKLAYLNVFRKLVFSWMYRCWS